MRNKVMEQKTRNLCILAIIFCITICSIHIDQVNNLTKNHNKTFETIKNPETALNQPNGKALLINQYANISNTITYSNVKSGDNVSYTLTQAWTSKNTTISYEGVAVKKEIIVNGAFDSDDSSWVYKTNTGTDIDAYWDGSLGHPDDGCMVLESGNYARLKGDYACLEQNISLPNEALESELATFSFYYYKDWSYNGNASLFMSVIIGNIEINQSVYTSNLQQDTWFEMFIDYDPVSYGQVLPGVVTIRVGLVMNEDAFKDWIKFCLDSFKFELYTRPNKTGIIRVNDNEFNQNYTYYNEFETIGNGYSFIEVDRVRNPTGNVYFTIYSNMSDILDFFVTKITLTSFGLKTFNSTISGIQGSLYSTGVNISWQVDFFISSIPSGYDSWVEFDKPIDWLFTIITDGFEADVTESCEGRNFGSQRVIIPNNILSPGLWKLEAVSKNYIEKGNIGVWDGFQFKNATKLTHGDIFIVNITLNDSITLPNSEINCTIFYPNASIFWQGIKEPTSFNEKYGNFTVGNNMTVGNYVVRIEWVNNQSYDKIDKVGYNELEFFVWHHTNLTAVDSYIEKISGDPCLIKVNYKDYDFDANIAFATVTYNSTFGQSGSMVYIGSGTYLADLDTSGLELGDYYFSFNASKDYYESQIAVDLIHLKIIAQPLALELPKAAVSSTGNDYAICQINVTGAFSGTLIWPANISTDWQNPYHVTDHVNGTFTLNFSTSELPNQGIIETFTVTIFANKTNYGDTTGFITIIVYPIETIGYLNRSIVYAYLNEVVDIKVNYTIEGSGTLISGANCSVSWIGSYNVRSDGDGFIISLETATLSIDTYTAIIKLEKPGFETIHISITVIVSEQNVNLTVSINSVEITENSLTELYFNEVIRLSCRAFALEEGKFLSGGLATFISDNYEKNLTEVSPTYFNTSIRSDSFVFNPGINYVYLIYQEQNYSTALFSFQFLIYEQDINLTVYIDSVEISENSLIELHFMEEINLLLRAFALDEGKYLSGGLASFISDNYEKNLTEVSPSYFNTSIGIDSSHFNPGLNQIFLRYQKLNYTPALFSFQFLIYEQDINLTVAINSIKIKENSLIELHFKEEINLLLRAFAIEEGKFLSGGIATFISGNYEKNLTEVSPSYFNTSIRIDSFIFNPGLNQILLLYQKLNYTTKIFSFQFLIYQQDINLSLYINSDEIIENSLVNLYFNDVITLSCKAYAEVEQIYLDSGTFTFVCGSYQKDIHGYTNFWFNTSISINSSYFLLGINYVYVEFTQTNYTTEIFAFQILVNQINIDVKTMNFQDSIEVFLGETILIKLNLSEQETEILIENASVFYSWEFGIGYFDYVGNGIYELELKLPGNVKGNHKIKLIISKEGSVYQTTEFSFIISIAEIVQPNYMFWYIIIGLIIAISLLGLLSFRAYVYLPVKRRKQSELLAKTQGFKDAMNVQGIVMSQRVGGLTLYSKSYYALESHKKDLLSGFIYAITTISQEFMRKEKTEELALEQEKFGVIEKVIELDFKYFNFLICDYNGLRAVFILKDEASDRFKKQVMDLLIALDSQLGKLLDHWDGSLEIIEEIIPKTLDKYCRIYYNDYFVLNKPKYMNRIISETELSAMESRVINVIKSMTNTKVEFYLSDLLQMVDEKNKDLVIIGLESLIEKGIIIPSP